MEEKEVLLELEILKRKLREYDDERNSNLKLDELRAKHRALPSPDSAAILYLIRKVGNMQQEINRQRNLLTKQQQIERDKQRSAKPVSQSASPAVQ